uniref:ENT domain-containing protein n=1 Tax=Meloidogyne incognita TaxID=6306 RepID=A0A914KG79_MELIC
MQPSTSAVQDLNTNILDEKDLEEEDAKFLLKALEKQAFEHVLYAFRAQGPLTKYKELILEHLKSALFITDQEFSLNLRIAANNPYLNEIVQKLNPSYDNFSEWLAAGLDLTGAELANSRRQQLNKNSTLSDHSTQILREIRRHNRNLSRESCGASEAIAELYQLPKRPFMPERLRKLLRDTEADGAVVDIPTETIKKEKSEILPQTTTKNTTTTTTKLAEATKQIKKRNVGRPRKYPRKEETNNNNNNIEQHKQQEKQQQQTKEETQKQINNNNHNTNNINCFKGKIWGKRRPNRWKDSDDTIKKEEKIASTFSSSIFANKIPEHLNNSFKQIYSSFTSNNSISMNNHIIQPSTSTNAASCSTEAMENLADLALAQLAEFPLIPSSSTSVSSSILMPPPPPPPPSITSINTSTNSTQIYGTSNNLKSTIITTGTTRNELFQQPNNNNKFNSQHKKDVKNDSDSIGLFEKFF